MTSKKYIQLGKWTALLSFIFGILIFLFYFYSSNSRITFFGYGYVLFVGIWNVVVFSAIILKSISDKTNRKKLWKTSSIMLINIPISIILLFLTMEIMSNMRITFTNQTDHKLTDINILGCETEHISVLEPQESKTVWVGITGDCSINIEYFENGERKTEAVAGYVTSGMGQKWEHKIDGKDKDIL